MSTLRDGSSLLTFPALRKLRLFPWTISAVVAERKRERDDGFQKLVAP